MRRQTVRVLIVDEREVIRRGVREMTGSATDIEVVGEAKRGRDVMPVVASTRPQVVIIADVLPDLDGIEVTRRIVGAADPSPSVIVTVDNYSNDALARAIHAGALGVLSKTSVLEDWLAAIRLVADGAAFLPPTMLRRLFESFLILPLHSATDNISSPELDGLSKREIEVLQAVGRGDSNREIARELTVSEATVKSHVSRLLSKLHAQDRIGVALFAWRIGLVPLTEKGFPRRSTTPRPRPRY